jgi:hypothetical protein
VVDNETIANTVAKIMDIKSNCPDNCMAQAFDKEYFDSLTKDQ